MAKNSTPKAEMAASLVRGVHDLMIKYNISLESCSKLYRYIIFQIVTPLCLVLLMLWLLRKLIRHVSQSIWPPTVDELRAQALGILKKAELAKKRTKDQDHYEEAKKLLQTSIKKDRLYLPSYLTLASVQLYLEKDAKESMVTIENALDIFPKDKDLTSLQLDAKAMNENMGHMVLAGPLSCRHLECIP
mmetsp:Transcript_26226/g.36754  ORF Transcript_26226/g.36754 Transcript_26226/m.36754 type:complete len:189 (+) Transcript_26226:230-796(+)